MESCYTDISLAFTMRHELYMQRVVYMQLLTHLQMLQTGNGSPGLSWGTEADIDDRLEAHPGCREVLRLTVMTDWQLTRVVVGY